MPANTSGWAFASATVSGSSGQPGVSATYPASSKNAAQRSQLDGKSQSPCTNTTGVLVDAFACAICASSCSATGALDVTVLICDSSPFDPTPAKMSP